VEPGNVDAIETHISEIRASCERRDSALGLRL
jgi:hypothetical protein